MCIARSYYGDRMGGAFLTLCGGGGRGGNRYGRGLPQDAVDVIMICRQVTT